MLRPAQLLPAAATRVVEAVAVVARAPDPVTRFVPEPLPSVECVFESTPSLPSSQSPQSPPSPRSQSFRGPPSSAIETGPASVVSVASPAQKEQLGSGHSSAVMRAASIAELDLDDAPTHLREPLFEEPPQGPRRRTTPPKIRKIDPTPPRAYRPYQPYQPGPQEEVEELQEPRQQRGMLPQRSHPTLSGHPGLPPITPPPTQPQLDLV